MKEKTFLILILLISILSIKAQELNKNILPELLSGEWIMYSVNDTIDPLDRHLKQ